jgi:hypothetical protein
MACRPSRTVKKQTHFLAQGLAATTPGSLGHHIQRGLKSAGTYCRPPRLLWRPNRSISHRKLWPQDGSNNVSRCRAADLVLESPRVSWFCRTGPIAPEMVTSMPSGVQITPRAFSTSTWNWLQSNRSSRAGMSVEILRFSPGRRLVARFS